MGDGLVGSSSDESPELEYCTLPHSGALSSGKIMCGFVMRAVQSPRCGGQRRAKHFSLVFFTGCRSSLLRSDHVRNHKLNNPTSLNSRCAASESWTPRCGSRYKSMRRCFHVSEKKTRVQKQASLVTLSAGSDQTTRRPCCSNVLRGRRLYPVLTGLFDSSSLRKKRSETCVAGLVAGLRGTKKYKLQQYISESHQRDVREN